CLGCVERKRWKDREVVNSPRAERRWSSSPRLIGAYRDLAKTKHENREIKMSIISPTPYPDVNEILDLLLSGVKEIVEDQFIGMYLFGFLANGDFDDYSDI